MADRFSSDLARFAGGVRFWTRPRQRCPVRFRDVLHITPVFTQILFYASPVAYQTSAVPEKWRSLFLLNPLAPLFDGLRWSLLGEGYITPATFFYPALLALMVFWLGLLIFHRAERQFADVI